MLDILVDKVMMECPICDETHLVEKRARTSDAKVKGEVVKYLETYYRCTEDDEDYVFFRDRRKFCVNDKK